MLVPHLLGGILAELDQVGEKLALVHTDHVVRVQALVPESRHQRLGLGGFQTLRKECRDSHY